MLETTDLATEIATLTTYVGGFSLLVLGAYGLKYGFKAGWNGVRKGLGVVASAIKG